MKVRRDLLSVQQKETITNAKKIVKAEGRKPDVFGFLFGDVIGFHARDEVYVFQSIRSWGIGLSVKKESLYEIIAINSFGEEEAIVVKRNEIKNGSFRNFNLGWV